MDEEKKEEEIKRQKFDRNFTLIFCGLLILGSLYLLSLTVKMPMFHKIRVLGPGAFPFGALVILIGLLVWLLIQIITGKGSSAKLPSHIDVTKVKRSLFLFGRVFIAILLLQFIGFVLSIMLFTFVEMRFFSEKKLKLPYIIACSIIIPFSVYFLFGRLKINLPSTAWLPF